MPWRLLLYRGPLNSPLAGSAEAFSTEGECGLWPPAGLTTSTTGNWTFFFRIIAVDRIFTIEEPVP
jgi:hypothetical protein